MRRTMACALWGALVCWGAGGIAAGCGGDSATPPGSAVTTDAAALDGAGGEDAAKGGDDAALTFATDASDGGMTFNGPGSTPLPAADKLDILFDIDNSSSMGDKEAYLEKAIPDLVARFVTPNCVDSTGAVIYGPSDAAGHCAQGQLEFPPIRDIHLGIVSSSLGARLGNACSDTATITLADGTVLPRHNDDHGELLFRAIKPGDDAGLSEVAAPDIGTSHFLDWYPDAPDASADPPALADVTRVETDFQNMVAGTHQFGCGIESQLESWYRFLVQPDPYASLKLVPLSNGAQAADWDGVDKTILAERKAFLRPDSVVLVVSLTDENDSEIDVRAYGGSGYLFNSTSFPPPHGTSACATDPNDPNCKPCSWAGDAAAGDPACSGTGKYTAPNDWGFDIGLRHVHMKEKYGADPQYPIERYVMGLTSATVPNRDAEHPPIVLVDAGLDGSAIGAFDAGPDGSPVGAPDGGPPANGYGGLTNHPCTNPLFAASLPDGTDTSAATLCNLPLGTRPPERVFFMHIGGVPHQLLQVDPSNPDSATKDKLADADWTKILGRDPQKFDYTGIDPHMIESYAPRPGLPTTPGADPISDHEWATSTGYTHGATRLLTDVDLEYACIFKLDTPRDCSGTDEATLETCECAASGLTAAELPAVCSQTTPKQQVYAKVYPTIRELLLAKLVGDQGIVSSLCPIHTSDTPDGHDPLFGYRPGVHVIVNRLKPSLDQPYIPH